MCCGKSGAVGTHTAGTDHSEANAAVTAHDGPPWLGVIVSPLGYLSDPATRPATMYRSIRL
jgi:hypothetical protein